MPRRCFPMNKPDYERITELVRQYHRKGHVTTAWWEEEMWGRKHHAHDAGGSAGARGFSQATLF
jgi:hypothetical protein